MSMISAQNKVARVIVELKSRLHQCQLRVGVRHSLMSHTYSNNMTRCSQQIDLLEWIYLLHISQLGAVLEVVDNSQEIIEKNQPSLPLLLGRSLQTSTSFNYTTMNAITCLISNPHLRVAFVQASIS
jgi:hypothetical protein